MQFFSTLFVKESWKSIHFLEKNIKQYKMFLTMKKIKICKNIFERQISILQWFLKDHMTLKSEEIMLKIKWFSQYCETLLFILYSWSNQSWWVLISDYFLTFKFRKILPTPNFRTIVYIKTWGEKQIFHDM